MSSYLVSNDEAGVTREVGEREVVTLSQLRLLPAVELRILADVNLTRVDVQTGPVVCQSSPYSLQTILTLAF